ncbi:hypothetical protein CMI37_35220 [Candidatus Pacearchaeota archaeon]|nr:hypothetical protein [Candidatus Pacearchaeota archaeon]|tara:strand:+ start:4066 stop:5247 length:1182 start_codon:yes stop_codon:yes gene_type:complete
MHVLESYALQNDFKIDKPFVYEKFFPMAVEKFITIDTSSVGSSALIYDHWQIVVDLIHPYLEKEGIKIVQLGNKECKLLKNCYTAIGQCNFNQKAYVITRSLLHTSPNNESSHIASLYNKKSVILFSNNSFPEQFLPYWTDEECLEILVPDIGKKPTFNPSENPKSINEIPPEKIALKILNFLGIYGFSPKFRTVKIGPAFNQPRIESDLTNLIDPHKLSISSIIVRMDLNFKEEALVKQLEACSCSVITNRAFDFEILQKYHERIVELVYYLEDDNSPDFIRMVKEKSINYLLRSRKTEEETNCFKLDYMDYGLIHQIPQKAQNDFEELKGKKKLHYKSNYFIIHDNKFYTSEAALRRGVHHTPSMQHEPFEIIDTPLFWEQYDHFHFLEEK